MKDPGDDWVLELAVAAGSRRNDDRSFETMERNVPARGRVKANLDGQGLVPSMTRGDLADLMIANLDKAEWIGKSPLIGY